MARFGSKQSRGIRQNVRVENLRNNVLGTAQNQAETFLRPEAAIDIMNMHASEEGSWSADRAGYEVINNGGTAYESGASLDGMTWHTDAALSEHLMVAINGKLGEIDPDTGVLTILDASAGYTAGNAVDFEFLRNSLYSVDGVIAGPRKWNGTASSAAGWPVSDGGGNTYTTPQYLSNHQGRLVALCLLGGTGGPWPSHFVISEQSNPEGYSLDAGAASAFIGECQPGDGQRIVGAGSIFVPSSNQQQLVVFKNRSTYVVTGSSGSALDADRFQVTRINGTYGALNNRCIVNVGNDILALNEFGVTSYTTLSNSGDIQPNAIGSDLVKDVIATMNSNASDKCWGIHLPHRREVIWFIPVGAATNCNAAIVYKYPAPGTQEIAKWSWRKGVGSAFRLTCGALAADVFYIGMADGLAGTMFTSSTYNGLRIPYRYEFPYLSLGSDEQIKRILHANAHFKVRGNQEATIKTIWLGGGNNDQTVCPLVLETSVGGALYGTGIYGNSVYGQQKETKVPFEPLGDGNRLKLILEGYTESTGPEFLGVSLIKEAGGLIRHWN